MSTPGCIEALRAASLAARGVFEAWELAPSRVDDLELLVTEICNNVVLHSYDGGRLSGTVELLFERRATGVRIEVTDTGRPFEAPQARVSDELAEHGRGLAIITSIARSVDWSRHGKHNVLTCEVSCEFES